MSSSVFCALVPAVKHSECGHVVLLGEHVINGLLVLYSPSAQGVHVESSLALSASRPAVKCCECEHEVEQSSLYPVPPAPSHALPARTNGPAAPLFGNQIELQGRK